MALISTEPVGFSFARLDDRNHPKAHRQCFCVLTSQETGPSERLGEPGIELGTPEYKASGLSTTPRRLSHVVAQIIKELFPKVSV